MLGKLGGLFWHVEGTPPDVAALCLRQMQEPRGPPSLVSAQTAARHLFGVEGFQLPSWEELAHGLRPPEVEPDDFEAGGCRGGWQHEAYIRVERQHRSSLMVQLTDSERAFAEWTFGRSSVVHHAC